MNNKFPKMLGRTGLGLLVFVGLVLIIGLTYQSVSAGQEAKRYPAPGMLVDVDGHDMHLYCTGSGSPTVLLEAGLGGSFLDWSHVQPEVAEQTRVCAYDRAGLGFSDYVGEPQDAKAVAQRLHAALMQANLDGPYVLVGHSLGGIYVRTFAQHYPDEVVGMVLVDSSHEQQMQGLPDLTALQPWPVRFAFEHGALLARLGIVRVLGVAQSTGTSLQLDDAQQAYLAAYTNRPAFWRGLRDETATSVIDTNQPSGPQPLGDIPLVVLTAGETTPPEIQLSPEIVEQLDVTWAELQAELVGLSTQSEHVVAEGAGHYIHVDRPDLVIESIQQVLRMAK